jgi:hypothetical protein
VPCLRVTAAADGEDDGMYLVSRTIHHSCVFFLCGGAGCGLVREVSQRMLDTVSAVKFEPP